MRFNVAIENAKFQPQINIRVWVQSIEDYTISNNDHINIKYHSLQFTIFIANRVIFVRKQFRIIALFTIVDRYISPKVCNTTTVNRNSNIVELSSRQWLTSSHLLTLHYFTQILSIATDHTIVLRLLFATE